MTSLASLSGQGGCGVGVGERPFPSGSQRFEASGAEALKAGGDARAERGCPVADSSDIITVIFKL